MADTNTIARPYAKAAFELARENDELAAWSEALATASDMLADGRVVSFLANPALTEAKQLEFLTGLFAAGGTAAVLDGSNTHGRNFLKLLLENDRIGVLPDIATHFDTLKSDVENTVDVTVTSAVPMSSEQQAQVITALQKRLGRSVNLTTEIDKDLIGGAVIRAGDVVIDGSLRARLEGLARALTA